MTRYQKSGRSCNLIISFNLNVSICTSVAAWLEHRELGHFCLVTDTNSGRDVMRAELACLSSHRTIRLNLARENGADVLKIVVAPLPHLQNLKTDADEWEFRDTAIISNERTSSELEAERSLLLIHLHGGLAVLAVILHHCTSLVDQFLHSTSKQKSVSCIQNG